MSRASVIAWSLLAGSVFAAEPAFDTLIAHRGESVDAPENTLPAYRMAVERGFGFECDVYLSSDGRVFTFHDATLTRTTGGANTNACGDVSWDVISQLDVGSWGRWAGSPYAGTRPALLEEVLELARDGRYIYVEVKPGAEIVPYIKDVFEAQANATPSNVLFISFNESSCRALKEQMPDYKVYWLKSGSMTAANLIAKLQSLGVDGVDYCYSASITTAGFISAVRAAGFEFHVWTVNTLDTTLEAFARGAQTVTTDCAQSQRDAYARRQAVDAAVAAARAGGYRYEPRDYVQDGLILHLDGIRNVGAGLVHDGGATNWIDLVSGNVATFVSGGDTSAWMADGFRFGGATYAELANQLSLTNTVTVQVVCDVDTGAPVGTNRWPTLAGAGNADACNIYYDQNGGAYRLTFKNADGGHCRFANGAWKGRYATAVRNGGTNWLTQTAYLSDGVMSTTTKGNMGTETWRVGSSNGGNGGVSARYLTGIVKCVRVYDRVLTEEELVRNRVVDEVRFFGAPSADAPGARRRGYGAGDYVRDGLAFQLDGIRNAGAERPHDNAATAWADLAGGNAATFGYANGGTSGWTRDGYAFTEGGAFARLTREPDWGRRVTIQIVCDAGNGTTTWPTLFGSTNDFCNIYTYSNSRRICFKPLNKSRFEMSPSGSWGGRYATAIWNSGAYTIFQDTTLPSSWLGSVATNAAAISGRPFFVGGGYKEDEASYVNARRLEGTVKAVRVYSRVLTEDELRWNRLVDEQRFFGDPGTAVFLR